MPQDEINKSLSFAHDLRSEVARAHGADISLTDAENLANLSGLPERDWSRWLSGELPGPESYDGLALFLKMDPDDIAFWMVVVQDVMLDERKVAQRMHLRRLAPELETLLRDLSGSNPFLAEALSHKDPNELRTQVRAFLTAL